MWLSEPSSLIPKWVESEPSSIHMIATEQPMQRLEPMPLNLVISPKNNQREQQAVKIGEGGSKDDQGKKIDDKVEMAAMDVRTEAYRQLEEVDLQEDLQVDRQEAEVDKGQTLSKILDTTHSLSGPYPDCRINPAPKNMNRMYEANSSH